MDYRDDDFEWDREKSERCLRDRRFDFQFASRVFDDRRRVEAEDDREEYGEVRIICVGAVEDVTVTVVYTWRGWRRRIISAWRSSEKEQYEYFKALE